MARNAERSAMLSLALAVIGALALVAVVGKDALPTKPSTRDNEASVWPASGYRQIGDTVFIQAQYGASLRIASQANAPIMEFGDRAMVVAMKDERSAARSLSIPISMNWRHPLAGLPTAQVLRIAEVDGRGRSTEEKVHTLLFTDHGDLPILSLVLPHGALFDPDTGIMVVGNGIFHAPEKVLTAEYRDPRWWKYPGNFHMRGKEWERQGIVQFIGSEGDEIFQDHVGVRMNGQMTRSFPQHALRLEFPERLQQDIFGEPVHKGYSSVIVRAAGNDQIKAMLRDAFQHDLCAGLPFEVSGHRTCVLYINGAYWGVHHIRHRLDEDELARRYGIRKQEITILEDEARLYRGDTIEVARFERLAQRTAVWNGLDQRWMDTLNASLDVDGFLAYMATQMILGNMDWPSQNVKFWRFTGAPRHERPLDGRWYFMMGDSDLGYGVHASPSTDMFIRANALDVPITQLYRGMMRDPRTKARFIDTARKLAQGTFSAERSLVKLDRIVQLMAPEMTNHTRRWRRPADVRTWMEQVDIMRSFAMERSGQVLRQLRTFGSRGN